MKMGGFSGAIGRLNEATEEMLIVWEETKTHWNDSNCHAFEENYVIPLYNATRQAVDATRMMAEVSAKAYRECTRGPFDVE